MFLSQLIHTVGMRYDPSISIDADDDVYPPSDDSIFLIHSLDISPGERILEIGCGSGVVSIHCAVNGAKVTCGDINLKAVQLTKDNFNKNGLTADVIETDVYSNITGEFDTIIFNLPYLPVDEKGALALAWSGGKDGLGPLPRLLSGAEEHLSEGGRLMVVVSSLMDEDALGDLLSDYDFKVISMHPMFFETLKVLEITL